MDDGVYMPEVTAYEVKIRAVDEIPDQPIAEQ